MLSNICAASVELSEYLLCFVALLRPFMLLLWTGKPLRTGWWPDSFSQLWFIIIRSPAWSAGLSGIISHSHSCIHNCAHPGLLRDYPLIKIIHYECTVILLLFSWNLVVAQSTSTYCLVNPPPPHLLFIRLFLCDWYRFGEGNQLKIIAFYFAPPHQWTSWKVTRNIVYIESM